MNELTKYIIRTVALSGVLLVAPVITLQAAEAERASQAPSFSADFEQAYSLLAKSQAADAWVVLQRHHSNYSGDVEFSLMYAIAALETEHFDEAQSEFRLLSIMTHRDDPARVANRTTSFYRNLANSRVFKGSQLPLPLASYDQIPRQQRLNINLNRQALGLPFIGSVKQWREFSWLLSKPVAQDETKQRQAAKASSTPVGASNDLSPELAAKVQQARGYIQQGLSQTAFDLLNDDEFEGAGNIEFDYVLGTAAIDSGHADQAIFVLLRVLNQRPQHAGARIELARAYYANGDYEDAQRQFETVLQQNPPVAAKNLAEQYLVAIDEQLSAKLKSFVPFVDVRVGYDTNANGATEDSQPFRNLNGVPSAIQGLTLSNQSLETPSSFLAVSAGTAYSNQFKPRKFVRAGAQLSARSQPSAHFVDTRLLSAYSSLEWRSGANFASAGLDVSNSFVGGDFNSNTYGLNVTGGKPLNKAWTGMLQLRAAVQRFTDTQDAKDSTGYTVSALANRRWAGKRQATLSTGLIAQRLNAKTAVNSKNLWGLQSNLSLLPMRSTLLSISYAYLLSDYEAAILGSEDREDTAQILGIAVTRYSLKNPNLKWLYSLDMNLTDSTLGLYDSNGVKASVGVRYDFR